MANEIRRTGISLSKSYMQRLDKMKAILGCASRSEVVRRALDALEEDLNEKTEKELEESSHEKRNSAVGGVKK